MTLVRHGQARPFEADGDRLSSLGETQAQMLGAFWARCQALFHEVYAGSLLRHRRTAELVGESYAAAGLPWPAPEVLEELNEYDAHGILSLLAPKLAEQDLDFRNLADSYVGTVTGPERSRHFQTMFETVMIRWLEGAVEASGVEPWPAFRDRVRRAIQHIARDGRSGRRVAVFTSGGPIGVAVQLALAAPDRSALAVNWRVRNCSLTEFVFSKGRFSLDAFNALPHLNDPSLWTFR